MNAFETHGVGHLSASTINSFISNPCIALMKIAGYSDPVGAAAWRGTAIDKVVTKAGFDRDIKLDDAIKEATSIFDDQHKNSLTKVDQEKIEKERAKLGQLTEQGLKWIRSLPKPDSAQGKVVFEYPDIPVPMIGYYDLIIGDDIRDMKTSLRRTSTLSHSHERQLSVYWRGTGKRPWVDYICPSGVSSFSVENIEHHDRQMQIAAHSLHNLLKISDDIHEILGCFYPDFDNWMMSETQKNTANDIWNMEGYDHE